MPADNDHVESSAQISAPSASTPSTAQAQAIPQVYPQLIASNFPLPSSMKCQGDVAGNWEFFKQQWIDYEIATGLDKREESVRLATLRSAMGRECLQILLNLNLSEEDKKKINKCLEALEKYFKPTRNVVYERYVFNTCSQTSEESVQTYVTRLRKLAASCEYGALTDEFIRDRLVIGLKNQGDKVRLLREKPLTLQKAIEMCTSSETASYQMKTIEATGDKQTEDVKKLRDKKTVDKNRQKKRDGSRSSKKEKKNENKNSESSSEPTCKYCGRKQRHTRRTGCPAFKQTCSKCNKKGHFASVCRSSKKGQQFEEDEESSDESCLQVETVSLVQTKAKQWFADVSFFKSAEEDFPTTLACQLDTGATCNELCLDDLSIITQLGDPPMDNSSVKLKLFGGSTLKSLGECKLHVQHKGKKKTLKFQVVENKCKPLLSAATCEKLQLICLNVSVLESLHQMSESPMQNPLSREDLLKKYHEVFSGLGHIGDAKIVVDKNVTPVQHSPRRVPVALQKDVKKKILELEEQGIIKKAVEPSEWISSMVIVAKPDILVVGCGDTDSQALVNHDQNVIRLLERAKQVNLKLNKNKVKLREAEVKFMGHVISKDGLKPDPEKVSAIKNMPKPRSKPEVLTLLGFVNYLSKFLPKLSDVSAPLRELTTGQSKFTWAKQHDEAFATIQQLVIQHPVLKFYNIEEEVTIHTDACDKGLGAVLLQSGQPVAFASRTLSPTEKNYATIEKECLAIVYACERFNQYLARREKIFVETDHKPLESIFKKSLLSAPCRLQRMLLRLQRFNLSVSYKPGSQMFLADHLSRAAQHETQKSEESFQVFSLKLETLDPMLALKITPERLEQLQRSTGQDDTLQTLKTTILTGWPMQKEEVPLKIREYWSYREELAVHNGVLFKGSRVVIPQLLRPEVKSRIHSSH
ncbi:uncharacterized protein [Porites lutea]|uniref:uncharacterized protein n=1 Tax=Porites lutea TaxID=51062 RepID=UPI003CC55E53